MPNKKTCLDFKGVYLILGVCVFEYEVAGSMWAETVASGLRFVTLCYLVSSLGRLLDAKRYMHTWKQFPKHSHFA